MLCRVVGVSVVVSLPVLVRRVLGRRGVFLLRNVVSGLMYYVGLYEYADSAGREDGISVMMCTYNEGEWVEPSILSVKDFVDEYVVVDSSSDDTPEIVRRVAAEEGLNIKLFRVPPGDLATGRLISLKNSSYKWILHLDADMIFYEDGGKVVKEVIESLNPRRHYLIYWKYLLLCGDLHHVCGDNPYHIEHWLFTYSGKLTYKYLNYGNGLYMDTLIAPLRLYKPIFIDKVLGVHLAGVRSPEKLAVKYLRAKHRRELLESLSKGDDVNEVLARIARQAYGVKSLRELGEKLIKDMLGKLPKYDEGTFRPLPKVLIKYLKKTTTTGTNSGL